MHYSCLQYKPQYRSIKRQLMIAMVTCLYTSGDPLSIENYRAISILVAFIKILEKIAVIQIVQNFTMNNLFCKS